MASRVDHRDTILADGEAATIWYRREMLLVQLDQWRRQLSANNRQKK